MTFLEEACFIIDAFLPPQSPIIIGVITLGFIFCTCCIICAVILGFISDIPPICGIPTICDIPLICPIPICPIPPLICSMPTICLMPAMCPMPPISPMPHVGGILAFCIGPPERPFVTFFNSSAGSADPKSPKSSSTAAVAGEGGTGGDDDGMTGPLSNASNISAAAVGFEGGTLLPNASNISVAGEAEVDSANKSVEAGLEEGWEKKSVQGGAGVGSAGVSNARRSAGGGARDGALPRALSETKRSVSFFFFFFFSFFSLFSPSFFFFFFFFSEVVP
mmetsp:Transcript_39479/g.92238  ORF Transcript_39479/g.92238 Transcript_39479/m.92238 type:complete len:278 (-) Transcript_39479:1601-2434(-)